MDDPMEDLTEKILKHAEKLEKEAWEKLSSPEKVDKLRQDMDRLKRIIYRDMRKYGERIDNIDDYLQKLEDVLERKFNILRFYNGGVVSTQKISCKAKNGQLHTALLLVYRDGTTTVKCNAECDDCKWSSPEL
jgi:septation ring formation regulator EzrA